MRHTCDMRSLVTLGVTVLALGVAVSASLAAGAPVPASVDVTCDLAAMGVPDIRPGDGDRVILGGRLAVPPTFLPQLGDEEFPMRYFVKWGILVKPGKGRIEMIVPQAWRKRVAIEWGGPSRAASALRISGCPAQGRAWIMYPGGFHVTAAACVPLIIRAGGRSQTVRFGVGRRC
jgi:hypothetical protein